MDIKQKVFQLAKKAADDQGLEIFDIEFLGRDKLLLRIFIDKKEGITIEDCEKMSKYLGAIFDVEDPFPGPYTLEVSSPGLDRPLKSIKDFEKNSGKLARIITGEKVENQNFFIGRIIKVNGNLINLLVNKRKIDIPYEKIVKAKLEVEL